MRLVDEGLELLDEDECFALLATRRIGRVGLSVRGLPAIFPVNYRLLGTDVVFATGAGLKLKAAHAKEVVAFEVDDVDEDARTGWSVLVVGLAEPLDHAAVQLRVAMDPWPAGDRTHLVRINGDNICGRRIATTDFDVGARLP